MGNLPYCLHIHESIYKFGTVTKCKKNSYNFDIADTKMAAKTISLRFRCHRSSFLLPE